MTVLKVCRVGDSLGVVLPEDLVTTLQVRDGDTLLLTETPDGYRLSAADQEGARQMEIAEKYMHRYRTMLRALAR